MTGFVLHLAAATRYERVERVLSFIGEDESGSFGIQPGHIRFMTSLVFGLARFRAAETDWEYLAVPGALVYFVDNHLYLSTRSYLRDGDYARISTALKEKLLIEEHSIEDFRRQLKNMEHEMLKRLCRIDPGGISSHGFR